MKCPKCDGELIELRMYLHDVKCEKCGYREEDVRVINKGKYRMTLDEAINHCEDNINEYCDECSMEHEQLMIWLKDYKRMREDLICG